MRSGGKRRYCSSYSYLQSSVLFAPPGRHASHHRLYLLNQRSPYSAVRAACQCAPSFRLFPRHRCCGLIASFPGPCASSGGRLPEALFMVFQLDSRGAKACKSCTSRQELSNGYFLFSCKIRLRYSRERASQSLPKISQKLEERLEKTWRSRT